MKDELKVKYHDALRDYYNNDENRIMQEKADKQSRIYNSMGYYTGKIVSGYIIGCIIGTILGLWFIWAMLIEPWVIPIIKIFLGR